MAGLMSESLDGREPEFRLATTADVPEMLGLFEAAFGEWPAADLSVSPLEHLKWKMELAPGVPATHPVGLIDGWIVAAVLRWGAPAKLGDRECFTNTGADLAVHPDFQGRGFGGPLAKYGAASAMEHSDFGFGTPSRNARVPRIYENLEYEQGMHALSVWVRAFDLRTLAGSHFRGGFVRNPVKAIGRVARAYARSGSPSSSARTRIEELDSFDERVDRLWAAARGSFDFAIVRSSDYLNWRYCDARGGKSSVIAALEGDEMVGYAVFKQTGDSGTVVDLLVHPDQIDVAAALLDAGSRRLRNVGCRALTCWLPPGHPYERALSAARFVDTGGRTPLQFWDPRSSNVLEPLEVPEPRIHCTLGDFDWV